MYLRKGSVLKDGKDVTAECALKEAGMPEGWAAVHHRDKRVGVLYPPHVEIDREAAALGYATPLETVDG